MVSADITEYTNLITSEHADKVKFTAAVAALVQGPADIAAVIAALIEAFDLDTAAGVQLDQVGEWVGRTRYLETPLVGVYFSFDTTGLGFDEGVWKGPFDPTTGLVALPDDFYRTLLKAVIAANQWDGSIPSANVAYAILFSGLGLTVVIFDHQDMSMTIGVLSTITDAVTKALLITDRLALKPAGVRINGYVQPSVADTPFFGFDVENGTISGFDVGAWATTIT